MSKMPEIIQKKAKIVSNVRVAKGYYKLVLKIPEIARVVVPGQFVSLRICGEHQPLLRRPFSIHHVENNSRPSMIEILYAVVGEGTKILSRKAQSEHVDILGPLGNGFTVPLSKGSNQTILVGGGMGVAPLLFLAEKIIGFDSQAPLVLIGAKTKAEALAQKKFESLDCDVKISTDDGTAGFKGRVTDLLKQHTKKLSSGDLGRLTIYACGPKLMLRELCNISRQCRIPTEVSLDEYMACGLGVCLGCVVETSHGQKRVCRDGPVFSAASLNLGTS